MTNNLSRRHVLGLGAAGAAFGLSQAGFIGSARAAGSFAPIAEQDAVIAFAYVGPVSDEGWTWAHDQGRLAVVWRSRRLSRKPRPSLSRISPIPPTPAAPSVSSLPTARR